MATSALTKRHNANRKTLTAAANILGGKTIPAEYKSLITMFDGFRTAYAASGMEWGGTPAVAAATKAKKPAAKTRGAGK